MKVIRFICWGNSCRSPLAAALGNKYYKKAFVFESCGQAPAKALSEEVISLAEAYGLPLEQDCPKACKAYEGEELIYLDQRAWEENGQGGTLWPLADPYGKGRRAYLELMKSLLALLEAYCGG